jgi:divalent metal cation (Fe/Co/Zn/Cd) transporter
VKLPSELSLTEAHGAVERLEGLIRAAIPELRKVHTHIEPLAGTDWALRPASDATTIEHDAIDEIVRHVTGAAPAAVSFRDGEGGRIALVTITLPGEQPLPSAHQHAGRIEKAVRERCPTLGDVIVHTEPVEAAVRRPPASTAD